MTVLEQHIEIDLYVQQMNSAAYRKIRPEEKDRVLNNMVDKFIDAVFDETADVKQIGFQGNSRRLVDIKDLLIEGKQIPLYKSTEDGKRFGLLPPDYLYPSNGRVKTIRECRNVSPEEEVAVVWKAVVPFKDDVAIKDFYKGLQIRHNSNVLFHLATAYPQLAEGLSDPDEKFMLLDLLLYDLNRNTEFDVYWQYYNGTLYPNRLIFLSGKQHSVGEEIGIMLQSSEERFQLERIEYSRVKEAGQVYQPGMRLTRIEDLYDVLEHSCSKTIYKIGRAHV